MKVKISFLFILFFCFVSWSQQINVSGVVTDANTGLPIPSVNISIEGTTEGEVTDFDGNYSINAESGQVLVFSYVGYKTQRVTIENQSTLNILLEEDVEGLDEVIVVGYGGQKKADLTGAITTVKSEDIEKTPNNNVMQSLQGKVAGLQITSSGAPGTGPTVRIRGVNSFAAGGSPLYVVDGVFYDNIDFLDSSQIESISVLKDASSIAIFGQKGTNGVVIVETKGGQLNRKATFTYNGYTGVQNAQNVVKMANAQQFVTMANESGSVADIEFVQNAIQRFGRSRVDPNLPDVNTDWYDEILRVAPISSHSLGVAGGTEKTTYGINLNYFSQEGILDMENEYERFNIQSNFEVDVTERLKVGVNSLFSNATRFNPENGAWFQAYFAVPILPVFDPMNTNADPIAYSDATQLGYRGSQNPFPAMTFNSNRDRQRRMLASVFAEYDIIPEKLTFRTFYSHDYSTFSVRNVRLPYFISENSQRPVSSITRAESYFSNQYWDNILTYTDNFGDHNLKLTALTSYRDEQNGVLSATGDDITGIDFESAWFLNFADPASFANQVSGIGDRLYSFSYAGRAEYSYKNKFLVNATYRYEGDGRFPEEIWLGSGTVGLGWVMSEESFMDNVEFVDFLKLRGSWGEVPNGALTGSAGSRTVSTLTTAINDLLVNGIITSNNFTNLKREILVETNFGISARMFQNRLTLEMDYFIRDTERLVIPVIQPIAGNTVLQNAGEMRNRGFEFAASWSQTIDDNWSFAVSGNFATLHNEMTRIDNNLGYLDTGSAEFRQRSIVGEPIEAFFGLEVVGVYQNDEQVANDPIAVANNLVPGDFIYRDQNGDGIIDDEDRTVIGSYLPEFTFGGSIQVSYKNWDLGVAFAGQTGNEILNRKRGEVIFTNDTNIDADFATNRWNGEGTTNSYPSSAGRRRAWNQRLSTFFIEDGWFFRIQNAQLAYTFPANSIGKKIPEVKLLLTAERPLTVFDYNGFNPEVPNGVDRQTYPIPAIYTFGVNIKI